MRAFVFPGQGSQSVGMGRALAEASATAREVFGAVDEVLSQHLSRLMFEGPADELTLTANAQPAIMAHSMAIVRILEKDCGVSLARAGNCVAGHSLGEYSAICATGGLTLEDTAKLLRLRGTAMQDAVPVGEGAMCALLGADLDMASKLAKAAAGGEVCEVANDNDPSQVVLSGHSGAIERAVAMAKEHGAKRAVKLPVTAPFHSSLMQPAADAMAGALELTPPGALSLPLYANITASLETDPPRIRHLLVEQVTGRVRWRESAMAMGAAGVSEFVELGGKVLGPMISRSVQDVVTKSVVSMDDIEAFARSL